MLYVILGIVAVIVIWIVAVYNGLIGLKNHTEEAKSDIDVQTKKRYDLIPNLVETVKGYAKHEKSIFTEVAKLRSEAMNAKSFKDKAEKENMLSGALKSLFAVAENYPDLKANTNFQQLQAQLSEIEEEISRSRRFYNANVRDFNIKILVFPNNLIASMLGFKKFDMFEASQAERENVKVDFNDKK